ncbi:MAG: tol-pal system protein YbgF [Gammaproteobacteria bacterium]|nr:tol-pal system protein YbgF [Gammaproteobacteria bacterium]
MFYQLQLLREEVQALRGAVEEQQHRLDLLHREQQERYLGLDRRISALQSGVPTAAPSSRPVPPDPQPADTLPRTGGTEADAYRNAYAMIERGELDTAAAALEGVIEEFPNGQYTPNAFYWLGQLHRKAGELERARQSLVQVITLYPDHNKAPDALYNLGVVYAELGDAARARMYLGRVQQQHPESTAAGLARTYAANLP